MPFSRHAILAAFAFVPINASAELLLVEQRFGGMVCSSCGGGLQSSLARISGVESVDVKLEEGLVRIRLKPGNTVDLRTLQDRIKGIGFTAQCADVEAVGEPVEENGQWRLKVDASRSLMLEVDEDLRMQLTKWNGKKKRFRGVVESPPAMGADPVLKLANALEE